MKIKAVCQATGLSDRTVRYYIEQELIAPAYTENYLGRRTFDFSEADVAALRQIAVLRGFDFTVEEIRAILRDAGSSPAILSDVRRRTESAANRARERLAALSRVDANRAYTVAELAETLTRLSAPIPAKQEDVRVCLPKAILCALKTLLIFIAVWLPPALALFAVGICLYDYHYPVWDPWMLLLTLCTFLPSAGVLALNKSRRPWKRAVRRALLTLCVLCIPCSFILSLGIVSRSETADFADYRDFDVGCLANRNLVFQELFPSWPHTFENVKRPDGGYDTVRLDADYFYQYHQGFDYTFDIYAEWPLDGDAFGKEVRRATEVLERAREKHQYGYKYAELTRGAYQCRILYSGDEPFARATGNYEYLIFAWQEETGRVRYIFCASLQNGGDQPYYPELDW